MNEKNEENPILDRDEKNEWNDDWAKFFLLFILIASSFKEENDKEE